MLLRSMVIGRSVFLDDDILPALSAHFRDFYSNSLRFRAPLPDIPLYSLSVSSAISLERPFLQQEIRSAVWALGSGKAPGIDGFPVEFFRTFWEACSVDVFAFCEEFATNSVFLKEFNRATCVLVPKRPNPSDVTHFRPISILGTPYKIIAKPWLISAWWRIWEERNNRVFRGAFSSPDSVARIVRGDVQFAIRFRRRCMSAAE
ncbi:Transposon TX1 uncharacterized protein [Nymphaea thermarum]|nr:Transposon TX1 uncharacterized protein [Nymphaea thermarum]